MKKIVMYVVVVGVILFSLIQLIPFGHNHINPATVSEPKWSSPEARALVKEHCFQCHSNETSWPWYGNVAPASWLLQYDVDAARRKFNFSDWNSNPGDLNEMTEAVQNGKMPPIQYWIFHPNSRLNSQQKQDLINALNSSAK